MPAKLRDWLAPYVDLSSNWISLIGVVLVTTSTVLWLFLLPSMLRGDAGDPYAGILEFLILPMAFIGGLVLIPLGMAIERRRLGGKMPSKFPPLDLSNPKFRRLLAFVGATTLANVVIGGQLTYRAVHYMESVTFCGQTCHTVMKPEFTAYQHSPHARVPCVSCHIGPGANWFVKSKLSGSWQVISVLFHLYERPIPTPVRQLRPARETCEVCHWPQKYGGDRVRVIRSYGDEEHSEETDTVLLLHIGGGNGNTGIHGMHLGPGVQIRYAHSDDKRQVIPWVEYSKNGDSTVYKADGYKGDGPGNLPVRVMDCIDCHNRPSHTYQMPDRALNSAIAAGEIDAALPYVKKESLEILKAAYSDTGQAEREIPKRFAAFYQSKYPDVFSGRRQAVDSSARALLAIYSRNVFPEMRVNWGSYPNNLGHTDFNGCFRCHDERAGNKAGKTLTQDCSACHQILAQDEKNPKVLSDLGLAKPTGTDTGGGQ